jgi:anaerobic ribonucleoside-triphosphate reductase activating protein
MTAADAARISLHAILPRSRANGPGTRMVIWFQGCTLGCPACFNPSTHPPSAEWMVSVPDLVKQIVCAADEIEGVSISGGEPLQQAPALMALLQDIRKQTHASVLLFSGYTRLEIDRMPLGPSILGLADVLIAGRYVQRLHDGRGLRGSSNQDVCFLTPRYGPDDLSRIPRTEVRIGATGIVEVTGIRPLDIVPFSSGTKVG